MKSTKNAGQVSLEAAGRGASFSAAGTEEETQTIVKRKLSRDHSTKRRLKKDQLSKHRNKIARTKRSACYLFLNQPYATKSSPYAKGFDRLFVLLVISNVVVFMISTIPRYHDNCPSKWLVVTPTVPITPCNTTVNAEYSESENRGVFYRSPSNCCVQMFDWFWVEFAYTVVFTLELSVRLIVESSLARSFEDPFTIFDFLAVLPFYVALFVVDTSWLGYIFFLRIFRLLKVVRHSSGAVILWHSIRKSKDALIVPFTFCIILMMCFSAVLFNIEFLDATSTSFSTSWLHKHSQNSEAYTNGRRPQINSMAKGVSLGCCAYMCVFHETYSSICSFFCRFAASSCFFPVMVYGFHVYDCRLR